MFRALVLGLSILLLIVGLESLAIESVVIAPPTFLHGPDAKPMDIQVTSLAAWITIGLGTSLTLYTIFTRKPDVTPTKHKQTFSETNPTTLQLAALDYDGSLSSAHIAETNKIDFQEAVSEEMAAEGDERYEYEDEDEDEDEYEYEYEDEDEDEVSIDDFDPDTFNTAFDTDDLINE